MSIGYALLLAGKLGLDAHFTPEMAAYWARLSAWPGYRRAQAAAMAAQGVRAIDFSAVRPKSGAGALA